MSILSAQSICKLCMPTRWIMDAGTGGPVSVPQDPMITPFYKRSVSTSGKSFGLSSCSYDIRVANFKVLGTKEPVDHVRMQNGDFVLACSIERIKMPHNVVAIVHDKSSWAREGLALQNTLLDPGWEGFITLELSYHRPAHHIVLKAGDPIAQLKFEWLDEATEQPYSGKYQDQPAIPVEALQEGQKPDVAWNRTETPANEMDNDRDRGSNSTVKTLELDDAEQGALDAMRSGES